MFDISEYTFSKYKVVWPWISQRVEAAVVSESNGKIIMPEHNTSFVSFTSNIEAHYFCAIFNSAPSEAAIVISYAGGGGGIAAPSVLDRISIPSFSQKETEHLELAELSLNAHEAAINGNASKVTKYEDEIDSLAAKIWGLSDDELAEIKQSLEDM